MSNDDGLDTREARANDLYWDSDASVNDIAEALDLSKGTLYGMIHPRDAGLACPECGGGMEHPNRTARDRGFVTCAACGLEEEESLVREALALDQKRTSLRGSRNAPDTAVLATALLGAAAGIVVMRWLRRS
jgi:hypothetical protein